MVSSYWDGMGMRRGVERRKVGEAMGRKTNTRLETM
jgi:hypothetical protein